MKIVKPTKLPVLHRTVEIRRRPQFHVAGVLAFPLASPRGLMDEMAFWQASAAALGERGVFDEGFAKARGELLVCGSFFAPQGKPVTASFVRARAGTVDKRLAVVGDRFWRNQVPTDPEPFTTMPVDWTRAFGGAGFERNPYGKGAAPLQVEGRPVHPLPNIEPYGQMMRSPNDRPEPAGFLPMDVTFAQRRARAGTYDKRYLEEHFPGMPADMAPTFFNAAPEDQWTGGFFLGDEDFSIENMHPEQPKIEGRLPGLRVRVFVTHKTTEGERFREIEMRCDTVWLFPTAGFGAVIFHGAMPVGEDDAADIVHLVAACEDPAHPRPAAHYQKALALRLDKDKGALRDMSDSDLMPPKESGVAANLRLADMDIGRWTHPENLPLQRGRKGQERQFAEARARLEAEGLDPKDYGLAELPAAPPEPPLDDLDALAAYMEQQMTGMDEQRSTLQAKAEEAKARAREAFAEMGKDYDAEMAKAEKEGGGPPKFSAVEHLTKMSTMAADAAADGVPVPELDQMLADRRWWEDVKAQEAGLREMYRKFAHFQPAAAAMDAESSERVRTLVQLAVDEGESLARRDFTGASLAGMSLRGVELPGAFLERADLSGCDLRGADLTGAVLARASLRNADLTGAQLTGANLGGADLRGAVLERAEMTDAVLSRAELAGARFTDARLRGSDWMEARPGAVDLSGTLLAQCTFLKADFTGARLAGADLSDATFIECQLDEADFTGAMMEKTSFITCKGEGVSFRNASMGHSVFVHGCLLPDADFSDANLEKANFRGTSLEGARLDRANLAGADLSDCDASRGSFERASLQRGMMIRTKLTDASLRGANLMDALASKTKLAGADFTGANLYRADLSRAVRDARTSFAEAKIERVRVLPKADVPADKGAS
jgi:uncharacterized protein YjbI with pentapeptide repeats